MRKLRGPHRFPRVLGSTRSPRSAVRSPARASTRASTDATERQVSRLSADSGISILYCRKIFPHFQTFRIGNPRDRLIVLYNKFPGVGSCRWYPAQISRPQAFPRPPGSSGLRSITLIVSVYKMYIQCRRGISACWLQCSSGQWTR